MRNALILAGVSLVVLSTATAAQPSAPMHVHNEIVITAMERPTLIQHGHVYTVGAAGTLNNADVLIESGKIAAVGPNLTAPPRAKVIDAHGKPVTPGLMASWTQLGIVEIDEVAETNDTGPDQAQDSAAFDVADAINPNSTSFPWRGSQASRAD
jgi:imidazolonepropionase-like amidohydrolase